MTITLFIESNQQTPLPGPLRFALPPQPSAAAIATPRPVATIRPHTITRLSPRTAAISVSTMSQPAATMTTVTWAVSDRSRTMRSVPVPFGCRTFPTECSAVRCRSKVRWSRRKIGKSFVLQFYFVRHSRWLASGFRKSGDTGERRTRDIVGAGARYTAIRRQFYAARDRSAHRADHVQR